MKPCDHLVVGRQIVAAVMVALVLSSCGGEEEAVRQTLTTATADPAPETSEETTTSSTTTTTTATTTTTDPAPSTTIGGASRPHDTTTTAPLPVSNGSKPAEWRAPPPAIQLSVSLSQATMRTGESLEGVLTVRNLTDEEQDITRSSGQVADAELYFDGGRVSVQPVAYTQAEVPDRLAPREVRDFSFALRAVASERQPLLRATYDLFVKFCTGGGWWADGLQVRVTS